MAAVSTSPAAGRGKRRGRWRRPAGRCPGVAASREQRPPTSHCKSQSSWEPPNRAGAAWIGCTTAIVRTPTPIQAALPRSAQLPDPAPESAPRAPPQPAGLWAMRQWGNLLLVAVLACSVASGRAQNTELCNAFGPRVSCGERHVVRHAPANGPAWSRTSLQGPTRARGSDPWISQRRRGGSGAGDAGRRRQTSSAAATLLLCVQGRGA